MNCCCPMVGYVIVTARPFGCRGRRRWIRAGIHRLPSFLPELRSRLHPRVRGTYRERNTKIEISAYLQRWDGGGGEGDGDRYGLPPMPRRGGRRTPSHELKQTIVDRREQTAETARTNQMRYEGNHKKRRHSSLRELFNFELSTNFCKKTEKGFIISIQKE